MSNIEYLLNVPISEVTTYKTAGCLPVVVYPKTHEECFTTLEKLSQLSLPYFIIGKGSNLLISPNTTKICVNLCKMKEKIKIFDDFLSISAQTSLSKAFIECKKRGLSGIEAISTIPASIGGAIKNNASFLDCQTFDHLEKITLLTDGKIKNLRKKDITFSYRKTEIPSGIILSAKFKLSPASLDEINQKHKEAVDHRNKIQPKVFSCGCVFKNPENISAGLLIDKCGLKGKRKGGAVISDRHANFIINETNASYDDVNYLIEYAKEEVFHKFGILLEEEVEKIQ